MQCPKCGAEAAADARFCEACGTALSSVQGVTATGDAAVRCRCGAEADQVDAQGFCLQCGRRVTPLARTPQPRDHQEVEIASGFGGVTDRGRKHARNEDALALGTGTVGGREAYILVVCDGVSSSQEADQASEAAAQAAKTALTDALRTDALDAIGAMQQAIAAAHLAVCAVPHNAGNGKTPPLTTLVAALVYEGTATIGWVGDSRAYLLTPNETRPLTRDHSWVNDIVDAGAMSMEEAERDPQAHAITLCLGPWEDDKPETSPPPGLVTLRLLPGSRLLLCTDGLWNYAPTPEMLGALVAEADAPETALELARRLAAYANLQGGRDNITVAILTF